MDLTEAETEAQISDILIRHGWYPVKTDAALVIRGRGRVPRSHIPQGFPDMTYLLALPGTPLCLAALVETKTVIGKLSDAQTAKHAELRDLYGIRTHVLREPAQALALVGEGRRVVGLLRDRQQGRGP
ncbi:VRR-NUC domain-containing protein [Deinococcus sp. D7000]|nr:VRR-NUC domain-containing protein [Deinococcus sp. D7000]